jgi:hypothetical protein
MRRTKSLHDAILQPVFTNTLYSLINKAVINTIVIKNLGVLLVEVRYRYTFCVNYVQVRCLFESSSLL